MSESQNLLPDELPHLKIVLTEKAPEKLYVCSAKIRPAAARDLKAYYDDGVELSEEMHKIYSEHLRYCLSIEDEFYEAGPAADFSEILYIFRCADIEVCKTLIESDPFQKANIYFSNKYYEWQIHAPYYKGVAPPLPGKVTEIVVEETTPQTLIAGFGNADFSPLEKYMKGEAARPLHELLHIFNRYGEGSTGGMGIDWAVGPTTDYKNALHIMNVATIEQAKMFNELDAVTRWGIIDNFRYFEWCIHYPLKKVTPRHKKKLYVEVETLGAVTPKE